VVLDRQRAVEAGKEFPNLVVGEEGHVKKLSDTVTEPAAKSRHPSREGLYSDKVTRIV